MIYTRVANSIFVFNIIPHSTTPTVAKYTYSFHTLSKNPVINFLCPLLVLLFCHVIDVTLAP